MNKLRVVEPRTPARTVLPRPTCMAFGSDKSIELAYSLVLADSGVEKDKLMFCILLVVCIILLLEYERVV